MDFRTYINEINDSDEFSSKSLKELELLLQHHLNDLEEYKDSKTTAYESTIKDIKAIKKAISKNSKQKLNASKKVSGNQNVNSSDSMSSSGSQNVEAGQSNTE